MHNWIYFPGSSDTKRVSFSSFPRLWRGGFPIREQFLNVAKIEKKEIWIMIVRSLYDKKIFKTLVRLVWTNFWKHLMKLFSFIGSKCKRYSLSTFLRRIFSTALILVYITSYKSYNETEWMVCVFYFQNQIRFVVLIVVIFP